MDKKSLLPKAAIFIAILAALGLFIYLGLDQYLSLDYLKDSRDELTLLYTEHRLPVIAAYMLIYILVTALSLPGAAVLTLAGGGIFGFWAGLLAVSFASTIGATLACFVSRFLLREWVQEKFGDRLQVINDGIRKDGSFYLFTLRLVPLFPFFVINLLMGLTKMPLQTYYWVSQVGMLPGTAVYVNAGKELAKIDGLSGILSPGVLISFVILGLFPVTVKKILRFYNARASRKRRDAVQGESP